MALKKSEMQVADKCNGCYYFKTCLWKYVEYAGKCLSGPYKDEVHEKFYKEEDNEYVSFFKTLRNAE